MPPTNSRSTFGAACLAIACLSGCASPAHEEPSAATLDARSPCPDDFAISLTLFASAGSVDPAWFVLEPDGVLRVSMGERQASSPLPPIVRTLSRPEVESIWHTASSAGLISPSRRRVSEARALAAGGNRAVALVYTAAYGDKRLLNILADDQAGVAALSALASDLAELAWMQP